MRLVLVRHGQSVNNAAWAAAASVTPVEGDPVTEETHAYPHRVPDPGLTDLGTRQAQLLGKFLAEGRFPVRPTHLYASPTMRAVATARPLAEVTGLTITLHPEAYEVGGCQDIDVRTGVRTALPGATFGELRQLGGDLVAPPGLFPGEGLPWSGGFEPELEQALSRARRVVSGLVDAHDRDDVVVVVSHAYFAQFVLAAALGWSEPQGRFRVNNTSHLALRIEDEEVEVEWVNRTDHLMTEDVSE